MVGRVVLFNPFGLAGAGVGLGPALIGVGALEALVGGGMYFYGKKRKQEEQQQAMEAAVIVGALLALGAVLAVKAHRNKKSHPHPWERYAKRQDNHQHREAR